MRAPCIATWLCLVPLSGCGERVADLSVSPSDPIVAHPAPEPTLPEAAATVEKADANDPRWHTLVTSVAARYWTWGLVDDQARWAPGLCAMPVPGSARMSRSGDPGTHGDKVYLLYAKDPAGYGFPPGKPYFGVGDEIPGRGLVPPADPALDAVSQVVVKEAYAPQPADSGSPQRTPGHYHVQPASKGGDFFLPGEPMGLYMLAKVGLETGLETDAGWVYATVTTDGRVTSAGQVESCMGCHQGNEDRLFGLKGAPSMPSAVQPSNAAPR